MKSVLRYEISAEPSKSSGFSRLRKIHSDMWQEAIVCPEASLETAAHRLSLKQLRYCSYMAPDIAYDVRKNLSGKRRAIVLAYTIKMAGLCFDDDGVKEYVDELVDSMIDYPNVWKSSCQQDWNVLWNTIGMLLGLDSEKGASCHFSRECPKRPTIPRVIGTLPGVWR